MDIRVPSGNGRLRAGVSIWTALALLFVFALLVVGAAAFLYLKNNNQQLRLKQETAEAEAKKARTELEKKNAEDNAKLVLAQNQRDQVLIPVRSATNLLARLLSGVDAIQADAAALRTNDAGRAVGLNPELNQLARRFYDSELKTVPGREQVTMKLEGARRIEQQLLSAESTAFVPTSEMETNAQELITWSTQGEVKLAAARQALQALVSESKVRLSSSSVNASTPTLEKALSALSLTDAASRLKLGAAASASAKEEADLQTAKAEAERIKLEAQAKADAIIAEANALKKQTELQVSEKEAELKVQEAKTKVVVQKNEDEATKVLLRQKASDPQVLAELAPFTTPGYWNLRSLAADKKPLSYTALQTSGALTEGMRGLQQLVNIATSGYDKVRPRWDMNRQLWVRKPDLIEKVKGTQKLLVELGPVLVEKGLLQP